MDYHPKAKESTQLEDGVLTKINNLKRLINRHLFAVREQREKHPDCPPYAITEKDVNLLYEQFHAVSEEGERIDYNTFVNAIGKIDELLNKLRTPVQFRRTDILSDLNEILQDLEQTIQKKAKK